MSAEEERRIRDWHESAYRSVHALGEETVEYLGRTFVVPPGVFPPAQASRLLGRAVLDEVRETDRVLDLGTGCGVNAILAASRSTDVLGVDINPAAVASAVANAERNGVADRTTFRESDVFSTVAGATERSPAGPRSARRRAGTEHVTREVGESADARSDPSNTGDGRFDLIVFDPPFRWFAPRDLLEASMTDENYAALTRFLTEAGDHLTPDGRILMFFGTSGDLDHLYRVAAENGFHRETLATEDLTRQDTTITYVAFRLRRPVG
ncbi:methyltransferase [Actinophytocola sp. S1-96]|uniref:Methyltransferase n=2 Tax=Actinophytocola gossypii TaxID=2812003 RepID=A0ABT2J8S3_9PSEU|nr:methyltransferase [Actinophytocola gossypii]